MAIVIPTSGFKTFIIDLAREHQVLPTKKEIDHWALAVTNLSDDVEAPDDIEQLVINMKRAEIVTGAEMGKLLVGYLRERPKACT
jgi:hypothetical protein